MLQTLKEKLRQLLDRAGAFMKTDMRYIARGGFWLGLGQGISLGVSFILAVAFANLVPPNVYGSYKYILAILSILAITTLQGMNTAVMQASAKGFDGSFLPALKTKMRWGIFGGIASTGIALYYWFAGNPILASVFILVAAFIPFFDPLALWGSLLAGKKLFREATQYNTLTHIGSVCILITTLFFTESIFLIILAYLASYTLLRLFFLLLTIRKHKTNDAPDPKAFSFGKHLSAIDILVTTSSYIDSVLLFQLLGAAPLAMYSLAQAAITPIKTLYKSILNLAHPKFTIQDKEVLKQTLPAKIKKALFLGIPLVATYMLILPLLYKLFFPQYAESAIYAQVLALSFFLFPEKLRGIALTAQTDKRALYILNTINPIAKIVLVATLIPLFGIWGAVAASLLAQVFSLYTSLYFFRKM